MTETTLLTDPGHTRKDLRQMGQHRDGVWADERLDAVPEVALAHAGDGRVDRDIQ